MLSLDDFELELELLLTDALPLVLLVAATAVSFDVCDPVSMIGLIFGDCSLLAGSPLGLWDSVCLLTRGLS